MVRATKLFTFFSILFLTIYILIPSNSIFADSGLSGGRGTVVPGVRTPQTQSWSGTNCVDANGVATFQGFECIYRNLLRILIPIGGLAAFVVILLGGFQYITSAGDPKQAQKASGMITGAIIGLVVAVGIWFLFQILNGVTGLDLLRFAIPGP